MIILVLLIPILIAVSALTLYPFNGRRQFLHFDLVQFVYSFILMPITFVWLKSLLFFVVRTDLGKHISLTQLFVVDTSFSLLFLFLFAFTVIHSLTKSFEIHRTKDPLSDIFELSEYFHLTLSHFIMYLGLLFVMILISLINLLVPVPLIAEGHFYVGVALGLFFGVVIYIGTMQYESGSPQFWRLMKLFYAVTFLIHVIAYFLFSPTFDVHYAVFWVDIMTSLTLIFLAIFAEPLEDEKWLFILPFSFNFKKGFFWVRKAKLVVKNNINNAE